MPLVARRKPATRSLSPAPCSSTPTAPSASDSDRSLSQTRLDRISSPTALYHRTFFRWVIRLGDREAYPAAELKRRLEETLGPEVSALRVTVARPPAGMTAAEWEALEDRLQRRQAQADAITRTLESRQGPASRSRSMLSPSPAPVPASSGSVPECSMAWAACTDPFETE
jgi:hypothetical protein